jgi:hypothetical protein
MLDGDSKRQAIHSLKGYAYQIWQSLYEWVSLDEGQSLCLEGAEDIDIMGPGIAETVQVKDIKQSGSVTLNSAEVLKAISHFWDHKKNNSGIQIRYRFLTTAERGKEQLSPFGEKKGLDYWDDCKHKETDLAILKEFLLTKDALSTDLRAFIQETDDDTLRSELISSIQWDTGNPERPYLEELIKTKLVHHGYRLQIPPSESVKVLDALLKIVFEKASGESNRELTFPDFLIHFENKASVSVPISVMRTAVNALSAQIEGMLPLKGTGSPIEMSLILQDISPILPDKCSRRESLITLAKSRILLHKILVFSGTSGMGKSTIATLLVNKLMLRSKWINVRGKDAQSINAIFWLTTIDIKNCDDMVYVIDDISLGAETTTYINGLLGLINTVLTRNGYIIITTQDDLPEALLHYFPQHNELDLHVPQMTVEDIKELLELYGCPTGKKLDLWSNFIFVKAGGHPLLVHAKIRNLESKKWPDPSVDELTVPDDFATIKREVQKRLIADLPHEPSRILLYRLSIFFHPFKKEHALIMGDKSPSVTSPGEAFSLLIGPWVERLTSGYYRLSPLLKDIANEIWSGTETKELHGYAVKALLTERTLSLIEASNSLLHGILGEAGEQLMPLIFYLLASVKEEILPKIAEDLRWLTLVALSPGQQIYPQNPVVSMSLRHLQFRVSAEIDKDSALRVARAWEEEINKLTVDEFKKGCQLLFYLDTLLRYQVPFPLDVAMTKMKAAIQLLPGKGEASRKHLDITLPIDDGIKLLPLFVLVRCQDFNDLSFFIDLIDRQNEMDRVVYVDFFNEEPDWGGYLVDGVYLNEHKASSPKWHECIDAFLLTISKARAWCVSSLVSSAYHMIAVIYDEDLKDTDKAFTVLDEARNVLGSDNSIIEDARAMILFRQNRYGEALEIWERILSTWKTKFLAPLLAYRRAEISSAKLGNWTGAARLSSEASRLAKDMENVSLEIGFQADHAFAVWKLGDSCKSIELFVEVVKKLRFLPDASNDLFAYTLQKRIGLALQWLLNDERSCHTDNFSEPPPGGFSNNEDMTEKIKDYPLQPIEFFWLPLAEIELDLRCDTKIFDSFKEIYSETKYPAIRLAIARLSILQSLRTHSFQKLISEFITFISMAENFKGLISQSIDFVKEFNSVQTTVQKNEEFYDSLINLLCPPIIIYLSRNSDLYPLIELWRDDARNNKVLEGKLASWFDFLEVSNKTSEQELTSIMSNPIASSGERFISSLLLSVELKATPDIIFYANLLLFNTIASGRQMWGSEIDNYLEGIIKNAWILITEKRSFHLIRPVLNKPIILNACDDSSRGLTKSARILLAAKDAVNINIPEDLVTVLKKHAQQDKKV